MFYSKLTYILTLILLINSRLIIGQSNEKIEFTENKNQWNSNILFKAEIGNGSLFLEKNCFTFNFVNPEDVQKSKAHNNLSKQKYSNITNFHSYKMHFVNANSEINIYGNKPTYDYCNFFIGSDTNKWATKVKKFKTIKYYNIYNNIDMKVYSSESSLKYDFILKPGSNLSDISIKYEGVDKILIQKNILIIKTSLNEITEMQPIAYFDKRGTRTYIPCRFQLNGTILRFILDKPYETTETLIIDPQLIFSTYSGSFADNWGFTATFDKDENVYSGGIAFGTGYPISIGAYQQKFGGDTTYYWGCDVSIIKYDPTGTKRIYSTYLGGNDSEMPHSLIVNEFNELLIFGTTGSDNFPVSSNAYSKKFKGGSQIFYDNVVRFKNGVDIYVTKLSADGSKLLASTYIGGSDNDGLNFRKHYENHMMHGNDSLYYNYADGARGEIITDDLNNAYIGSCTFSSDFPLTTGSFQPNYAGKQEGIVFKLDYNLSTLIWSSYIGGTSDDVVCSIDVDNNYDLYVTGGTNSIDFPTSTNAYKPTYLGGTADGFIAHISYNGNKLLHSTYYGSPKYDQSYFVRTDNLNNVYITGQTRANGSTLIYNANYSTPNSGQFIAKFKPSLDTIYWSTVFGSGNGRANISPTAFAVDICNKIYLSGWGREWPNHDSISWSNVQGTKNMDVTDDAYQKETDGQDFYVMVITDDAKSLYYATYFGELYYTGCGYSGHDHVDGGTSRFDKRGNIFQSACASCGRCQQFPTYPNPGAWSNTNNSNNCNNAVFKLNVFKGFTLADFDIPSVGCAPLKIKFNNKSEGENFKWDFGDKGSSVEKNPEHTYTKAGIYDVMLIATNPITCNISDTMTKQITVLADTTYSIADINLCKGEKKMIGITPFNDSTLTYKWLPEEGLSDPTVSNPYSFTEITTKYLLLISNKICTDSIYQTVIVQNLEIDAGKDTNLCFNDKITIKAKAEGTAPPFKYQWSDNTKFTNYLNNSPDDNSADLFPDKSKTYYLKVTDKYCERIDSIKITITKIDFLKSNDTLICNGDEIKLKITNLNTQHKLKYQWLPENSIISGATSSSPTVKPTENTEYKVTITEQSGCKSEATIKVNIIKINADVVTTDEKCFGDCNGKIKLKPTGGTAPYSYLWEDNTKTDSLNNLCSATYKVTITDSSGCKITEDIIIGSPPALNARISDTVNVICNGEHNGSATVSVLGGVPPYSYIWNDGQTTAKAINLGAGNYTVTITDKNKCKATANINIIDTSSLNLSIDTISPLCSNDCNGIAEAKPTGGLPPYSYYWDDISGTNKITTLCPGKHKILIKDSQGCERILFFNLSNPAKLKGNINLLKQPICEYDCDAEITISASGGTNSYSYKWSNGNNSDTLKNLCTGSWSVTITDNNQCSIVETITIKSKSILPSYKVYAEKTTLHPGEITKLHVTPIIKGNKYKWVPKGGLNSDILAEPTVKPDSSTTYFITITDSLGCIYKDSIRITIQQAICDEPYIYIPNAFTPDKDNKNDVLFVRGAVISSIYFTIYNRWGEKVFETRNIYKGWDGTFKGADCQPGVYDYYLEITCINQEKFTKKGNITLIR